MKKSFSLPGYFGSISNDTPYLIEGAQVVGGYCANNPMPANGFIQMLPDPGSTAIQGHLMAFDTSVPGKYVDNLLFSYSEQKDGSWAFDVVESLYGKISVQFVEPDKILLKAKK